MRAFTTTTRDRGVVTIPVDLRSAAGIESNTALTWVEVAPASGSSGRMSNIRKRPRQRSRRL